MTEEISNPIRVLFCGDRPVAARIAEFIRQQKAEIVGLGLNVAPFATHAAEVEAAAGTSSTAVFYGRHFASEVSVRRFSTVEPHLGVCCGFASVIPRRLLDVPLWGWVNLHRSYLPYNRGLDPLQWAVVDGTPAGVTLHVMTEAVDAGAILAQEAMAVIPTDNFQTLSDRADELAFSLLARSWPRLSCGAIEGIPQDEDLATYHSAADCRQLRSLDLNATMRVGRLLDVLRSYSGDGVSGVGFELGPARFAVHTQVVPQGRRPSLSIPTGPAGDPLAPQTPPPSETSRAPS